MTDVGKFPNGLQRIFDEAPETINQTALAREIDATKQDVTRWLKGQRKIPPEKALKLALVLERPVDEVLYAPDDGAPRKAMPSSVTPVALPYIPILGRVAAGRWIDVHVLENEDHPASVFPPDPRFPIAAQFDLIVEGTSLNKFAQPGDRLRCVDFVKAGVEIYGIM